ncbi:hypothetical protein HYR99_15275 [Candidatus Poribacteria bacterium]|nr:hypothetical protein [Candidatus Poribacteria bacterium]
MASSSNEFVRRIENTVNQAHREQTQKIQAEYDAAVAAAEKRHQSDIERIRVNYEKEITTVRDSHRNVLQRSK